MLREGIEPSSDAYKAPASPAMLTEQNLVEDNGFEPFAPGCKPGVLAKYTNPPKFVLCPFARTLVAV